MRAWSLVLVASLLAAGCAAPAPGAPAEERGDGAAWRLADTTGAEWTDLSLRGEPALLFFMATWCSSCRTVAPRLAALHEEYGGRVQFLSVGWDPSETPQDLEAWAARHAQPWPHGADADHDVARHHDVRSQSVVVVLDAQGRVAWKSGYGPSEEDARRALDEALAASA